MGRGGGNVGGKVGGGQVGGSKNKDRGKMYTFTSAC